MGWETSNEEGLRGAYDPVVRDRALDQRRRLGGRAVRRRRRHHRDGFPAVRRRPGGGRDRRPRPGLRRGAGPQPVPGRAVRHEPRAPGRHRPRPAVPRPGARRRRGRVGRRPARHPRGDDPDDVARPPALRQRGLRALLGGVRRHPSARAHPLRGGAPGGVRRPPRHLPGRGGVVGGAPVVAPAVLRRLRAPPRPHVRGHRGRRLLDRRRQVEVGPVHGRGPHHQEDGGAAEGEDLQAAVGVLRDQPLRRGLDHVARRRSAAATSSASTPSCGGPTTRIPRARGRTRRPS